MFPTLESDAGACMVVPAGTCANVAARTGMLFQRPWRMIAVSDLLARVADVAKPLRNECAA
ncbi:MAG: hypothetical protein GIX01_01145 [Candidatus Eremiobacteraeota bacterium]|nr:hypothetical protein [Candidatus Eremiobacteraeota bacterium]